MTKFDKDLPVYDATIVIDRVDNAEGTYGFAITLHNGARETVYIPVKVMDAVREFVCVGDVVDAQLVVNQMDRNGHTPWMAIFIERPSPERLDGFDDFEEV